jgi:hypothetical protein
MTVGIGAPFGPHLVVPALFDPSRMGGLIDDTLPELQRGVDQRLWHTGAAPGAIHQHHAGIASLATQLVDFVVENWLVAEGPGR